MTARRRQTQPKSKSAAATATKSSIKIESTQPAPTSTYVNNNLQATIPIKMPNEMTGLDFYTTIQEYSQHIQYLAFYECFVHFTCRVCGNSFRSLIDFSAHKRLMCFDFYSAHVYDLRKVLKMNPMHPLPPAASSESQYSTTPANVVSSVCKDNLRRNLEEKLAQTLVQEIIDDTKVNKEESEIDVVFEDDEPVLTIDLNEQNDDDWLKRVQTFQEDKDEPKNEVEEKKEKGKIALKDITNQLDEIVDVEVEEIVRRKDGVKYDEKILERYPHLQDEVSLEYLARVFPVNRNMKAKLSDKSLGYELKKDEVKENVEEKRSGDEKLKKDVVVVLKHLDDDLEKDSKQIGLEKEKEISDKKRKSLDGKVKRRSMEDGEIFSELEDGEIQELNKNVETVETKIYDPSGVRRSARIYKMDKKPDYSLFEKDEHLCPEGFGVTYGYANRSRILSTESNRAKRVKH